MERRSWLWRRKSSPTLPPDFSDAGSLGSLSERFSDDHHQASYSSTPTRTPTRRSSAAAAAPAQSDVPDEQVDNYDGDLKALRDKLSAALLNLRAKDDLVTQHAKVAEEAVSGWEKAEKEVVALKQQLENATKKNSGLEDRVGHLDAALKECMRQLRLAREDQERRISEALANTTREWESTKSELDSQISQLQHELQAAKGEAAATTSSLDSEFRAKMESLEKENSSLKLTLLSRAEELEMKIMERDLSCQAAETASKQQLDAIKKVARLEAECRRMKAMAARKASPSSLAAVHNRSFTASSIYVESFTEDSQSDSGERLLEMVECDSQKVNGLEMNELEPSSSGSWEPDGFKNRKSTGRNQLMLLPSPEINLMDDFLEMERLAALADTDSGGSSFHEAGGPVSERSNSIESQWRAEHAAVINQKTTDLEEKLEKVEGEKVKLESALNECQSQLGILKTQLKEANEKFSVLQAELAHSNETTKAREEELKGVLVMKEVAESQLRISEEEIGTLLSKVDSLTAEVEKEHASAADNEKKCLDLENKLHEMRLESELLQKAELKRITSFNEELKVKQERELAAAAAKFAECKKTISSLGLQLKSLATMEEDLLVM
ncbi:unnamed protein product [Linum tenue]|uniref:Filament-like plant protein 3 n=1 Tax=Linum tenue TaxID=586396 RepID=A0AAV0J259_9ROSI|nr:unnamed protein product [Linum tenue]